MEILLTFKDAGTSLDPYFVCCKRWFIFVSRAYNFMTVAVSKTALVKE